MRLEGGFIASGVSFSASVPSSSGEIDLSGAIDFPVFLGTSLSAKSLSLMKLSLKNSASRASMMELVSRFRNLHALLSLAKPGNTHLFAFRTKLWPPDIWYPDVGKIPPHFEIVQGCWISQPLLV